MMKRHIWFFRILVLIFFLVFIFINNNYVKLNHVDINENNEPILSESFNILQISDLHGKLFSSKQRKFTLMFDRLEYDAVVLTGDMIDKNTEDFRPVEFLIQYFSWKEKPVFFVTGNHEGANPLFKEFTQLLESYGVIILDNSTYTFELDNQERNITFVGLSDPNVISYATSQPIVNSSLEQANNNGDVTVLLSHRPTFIKDFRGETDVMLSGHAHGGQIRLPFVGGIISPGEGWFPKYDYGLYEESDASNDKATYLYVNKGLGNSVIPIRLFNFPEVALLTINSK